VCNRTNTRSLSFDGAFFRYFLRDRWVGFKQVGEELMSAKRAALFFSLLVVAIGLSGVSVNDLLKRPASSSVVSESGNYLIENVPVRGWYRLMIWRICGLPTSEIPMLFFDRLCTREMQWT
jgi:hypothetical protein